MGEVSLALPPSRGSTRPEDDKSRLAEDRGAGRLALGDDADEDMMFFFRSPIPKL
jgi:hypothetical protein